MKRYRLSHAQIIALGFLTVIALGTLFLMLPLSGATGEGTDLCTALFTAVSASCVTGLVRVDTGSGWSFFGQAVILALIQIGGLGFMTIATVFIRIVRKRVSMRERAVMAESINSVQIGRITEISRTIIIGAALFELAGTLLLSIRFVPRFGWAKGLWFSLFHAVSAFCNAGFDTLGGAFTPFCSFTPYAADALVNLTLCMLIIVGGVGFLVWDDLLAKGLRPKRWTLHTKVTLYVSAGLIAVSGVLFYLFEAGRMNAGLPVGEQLLISLFSAVTPRTAGFNTVDTAALSPASKLLTGMLMFIGGSSGSTAGGVKTTTIAVFFFYLAAAIRGQRCAYAFGRKIPEDSLRRAAIVCVTNLMLALCGGLIIMGMESFALEEVLFEVFSAIGTVGMSTGVTRMLSPFSLCVVAFLMFCGRVGSVSFAIALLERRSAPPITYPEEQITVG